MFDHYRIPRDNLLSKNGDISADGKYVSTIANKKKRLGASFGALSGGRVNICGGCLVKWLNDSEIEFSLNF